MKDYEIDYRRHVVSGIAVVIVVVYIIRLFTRTLTPMLSLKR